MKKAHYTLFLLALIFTISCQSSKQKSEESEEIRISYDTLVLDTSKSTINWERSVENKVEHKQVKIFGLTTTVDIENAQFTSNGNIKPMEGLLILRNDSLLNWTIFADFMMVRLLAEKSDKILSTEKFPPTELSITKISIDTSKQYKMEGTLTIKSTKNPIQFIGKVERENSSISVKGEFKIQTLDYPIRENVKKENVIKDEILFTLNLNFRHKNGRQQ